MRYWDAVTTTGFYAGIVFLIIVGIMSGLNNLKEKEVKKMATDRIEKTTNRSDDYNSSRSLDDIGKIAPSTESTGSSNESDNSSQNTEQSSEK